MTESTYVQQWYYQGRQDLLGFQANHQAGLWDRCVVDAQQAAENLVKGVAYGVGLPTRKNHDFSSQIKAVCSVAGIAMTDTIEELLLDANWLASSYVMARYPSAEFDVPPCQRITAREARQALSKSLQVFDWALGIDPGLGEIITDEHLALLRAIASGSTSSCGER